MSIVNEIPGVIQVFSDGSIKRLFLLEMSPPSPEFSNGYKSKDITIDSTKPITARIFHPQIADPSTLLPVLLYFHGGGFCIGTTTWAVYHSFLSDLCVRSQMLIVSVDYRLAPEHRLQAAYDDGLHSLEWLSRRGDPWLDRADLSRVYLSGESAGGNMVHHVAVRALREVKSYHVEIKGLLIIHPWFGSEERLESEKDEAAASVMDSLEISWRICLPEGAGRNHFARNFEVPENGSSEVEWGQFPAVVVYVAGLDALRDRGLLYGDFLRKKGVKLVEVVAEEGLDHAYHLFGPSPEATQRLQKHMSEFMHRF